MTFEEMYPHDDVQRNYSAADEIFFSKISIHAENIHRVRGEDAPEKEIMRYSSLIRKNIVLENKNIPVFNWIILGLGTDGHVASLFPGVRLITDKDNICGIAVHPETG